MIELLAKHKAFIEEHKNNNIKEIALQASKVPNIDVSFVVNQIIGNKIVKDKIPSWHNKEEIVYPKHLSVEQCSSEATAKYKQSIIENGHHLCDLTGGMGVDCSFLAQKFEKVDYVEQQEELCRIAQHNFKQLNLERINVHHDNCIEYLKQMEPVDLIFIDPARRDENGGKVYSIEQCEPNISDIESLLISKAKNVMVKLSPMLDLTLALKTLQHTKEAHIVSVDNECKELIVVLNKSYHLQSDETPIHCVNITSTQKQELTFKGIEEKENSCLFCTEMESYLYEPNSSILKAGAYKTVAKRYQLKKLHPNSHLYLSKQKLDNFPGRSFKILNTSSLNKKEVKKALGETTKANVTVRNFPAKADEIKKRFKLQDGGDNYLFVTTLNNEQKIIIYCEKNK